MTLGENLQRLRRERGLSQEDMAQKLFVSRQSVSKWENDQSEPGVEYLKALAELYGVTLDTLLGQVPPAPPETADGGGEDETLVRQYRTFFAVRTVAMIVTNLLISLPAGSIDFPFDWIAMLVGLFLRKKGTWWAVVLMLGLSLCLNVLGLFGYSLAPWFGLVINGAFLWGAFRREIKAYFHMPQEE